MRIDFETEVTVDKGEPLTLRRFMEVNSDTLSLIELLEIIEGLEIGDGVYSFEPGHACSHDIKVVGAEEANEMRTISISARERDTIIAALRYWQRSDSDCTELESEIATNGGAHDALQPDEIDELIEERINV